MRTDPLRRLLRHGLVELQRHLRPDLTIRDGGLSPVRGGYAVWLECEGVGCDVWRGRGRLPRGALRRDVHLALADALADIAGRSGEGLNLWRK